MNQYVKMLSCETIFDTRTLKYRTLVTGTHNMWDMVGMCFMDYIHPSPSS